MKRILYIIDSKAKLDNFNRSIENRTDKNRLIFYICPITVNTDLVKRAKAVLSRYGGTETLPFIKEFHRNSFLYRDKFIKFLSHFSSGKGEGLINLRKYFAYPFNKFSLWWLSLVAEKSTLKKQSYHNLARLITIMDFKKRFSIAEIYIDIEDVALKNSILKNSHGENAYRVTSSATKKPISCALFFVKALGYLTFFIARKCIMHLVFARDSKRKMASLNRSKFLLITFFPFADKKLLKQNVFKSNYFGPLQKSIESRFKNEISWLGILQDTSGLNIDKIKLAKQINGWQYCFFFPEELVSFLGIASSLFVFLYICLKYMVKMPYLAKHFVFDYGRKINIWDIFREEWVYSFFGTYLIENILHYYAFIGLLSKMKNGSAIIYPAELYSYENALNTAKKKQKSKIKTIGIQHASVPFLSLNYFNTPEDLTLGDMLSVFPLPDYLASSGGIPKRMLLESGWPEERIFDIGAIRYHKLSKFLEKKTEWKDKKRQVVVALPSVKNEVVEILLLLWQAFRNENICTFVIKPHPACPVEDIVKHIGFDFNSSKFILDLETPMGDLLISSRAIITAGSASSLDGLICQCPVIIPRLSYKADMNPLGGVREGLARYVENENEFADAVNAIVSSEEPPIEPGEYKAFIKDYFTILDNEDEYFRRLERKLANK